MITHERDYGFRIDSIRASVIENKKKKKTEEEEEDKKNDDAPYSRGFCRQYSL